MNPNEYRKYSFKDEVITNPKGFESEQVKTYEEGRRCECRNKMSIYTEGNYCNVCKNKKVRINQALRHITKKGLKVIE